MTYTDTITAGSTKAKAIHYNELKTNLESLASTTSNSSNITFSGYHTTSPTKVNLKLLQNACNVLQSKFSGNCCQSECCQTCQTSANQSSVNTNQSCETSACESTANQSNQKNQACQSSVNQSQCTSVNQACKSNTSCCCCCGM